MFTAETINQKKLRSDYSNSARMRSLSLSQSAFVLIAALGFGWAFQTDPDTTMNLIIVFVQLAFLACASWRVLLVVVSRRALETVSAPETLPTYTIMIALHDEVEVMEQLFERLARIDYPSNLLQGMILVETHDIDTFNAARSAHRPDWLDVVVVPPGKPITKPRALNYGLVRATGQLLTVYDAEDDPHPLQLREAAARFAIDDTGRVACLQAPLRIRQLDENVSKSGFLHRQFAVEYAALFEVTLPGMARLGLPFPLGGTSNHFRTDVLRAVDGWDAYNVTEDADLGFRLWREGWRQNVMSQPTYELPPNELELWIPQRTRWLKGFMQTWGVHTRSLRKLGVGGTIALTMTLGATIASASIHAITVAWLTASVLVFLIADLPPATPLFAISVMVLGTAAAWLIGQIGVRRAGLSYTASDMILSPVYWSLLSLAFAHALWRLIREPFIWDKTRHRPDPLMPDPTMNAKEPLSEERLLAAGRRAA